VKIFHTHGLFNHPPATATNLQTCEQCAVSVVKVVHRLALAPYSDFTHSSVLISFHYFQTIVNSHLLSFWCSTLTMHQCYCQLPSCWHRMPIYTAPQLKHYFRFPGFQGSVVTQTVLGGLTIYPPVANFLQCACAKNYKSWLAI